MKKYKNKIFAITFILFTLFALGYTFSDEEPNKKEKKKIVSEVDKTKEETIEEKIIVDVKGQVANPGVYELKTSNTVNDAINVAGGLTEYSDTSNINLSKKLQDEMVIIVYSKEEIRKMKEVEPVVCPPVNDACITEEDEQAKLDEEYEEDGLININSASKEQLMTLEGIGESKAEAIIKYREENGPFTSIEDITNVTGIGEKAFEKIENNITV